MKIFLGIFAVCFLILSTIGFFKGRSVPADREYLRARVFRDVRPEKDGNYFLFKHEGKTLYKFNTGTNAFEYDGVSTGDVEYVRFPIDEDIIATLMSIAGLRAAAELAPEGKRKLGMAAAILGSVTGYFVGHKIGTSSGPDPGSPKIRSILEDKKEWINYETRYLKKVGRRLLVLSELMKGKDREHFNKFGKGTLKRAEETEKREGGATPREIWIAHSELQRGAKHLSEKIFESVTPYWLSWWFNIVTPIGSILLIVALCLCLLVKTKRDPSRKNLAHPTPKEIREYGGQNPSTWIRRPTEARGNSPVSLKCP